MQIIHDEKFKKSEENEIKSGRRLQQLVFRTKRHSLLILREKDSFFLKTSPE